MSLEQAISELTEATKQLTETMKLSPSVTVRLPDDASVATVTNDAATQNEEIAQSQTAADTPPPAAQKPPTKKLTAEVAVELGKAQGRDAIGTILKTFGVSKVPLLAEDQRTPFIAACEEAMKGGGEVATAVEVTASAHAEAAGISFENIKGMITTLATTGKTADVVAALQANNVTKATELKPEQYEAFAKQLSESL